MTQTVEDDAAATAPTVEVAEGWTFTGWDKAFDSVTADLTVTAQYEEVSIEAAGEPCEIEAPETTLTGKITWSAKNLPKGLKINSKTGVISGTPTAPGMYAVKVTAKSGKTSESFDVNVKVGHYADALLPLENDYEAQVGVKTLIELGEAFAGARASGLPAGLKFAAKNVTDKEFGEISAGTVYGVPTKAVTNCVIFTLTKSETVDGKSKKVTHTASATFAVAAAPVWSVGTFNGRLDDGSGSATLTVAASGKISGKVIAGGKTWSFSASGYDADEDFSVDATSRRVTATAKSGKLTASVLLDVGETGVEGSIVEDVEEGADPVIDASLKLWRNEWKDKGATDKLKEWVGLYTVQLGSYETGTGYLSLTFDAKGNCKATGKLPDGTSASATLPLVWDAEAAAPMAIWQVAPSAYKGGYVGGLLTWGRGEDTASTEDGASVDETTSSRQVTGEEIVWVSKVPTATSEYGTGFERMLDAYGAYYNKLAALSDYYFGTLDFAAAAPVLDATEKTTDYDENEKKITTSVQTEIAATEPGCWNALTISLDTKGTTFVVDQGKATKPAKVDGVWTYEGDNDAALTFSFAKATGIFKGSFTCWYDYTSATDYTADPMKETLTHTSKKVSYEGVMVLGTSLEGFYLWDRTGTYEDEKTGKTRTYKYKESKSVTFAEEVQLEAIIACKPVIYLYPETNTTCRVQLALNGELTCTYPEYGVDGWCDFIASPDGTLTFPNGNRYYCLYWEGVSATKWDFSQGYCVRGSDTASFLADVLSEMGLTFREANEFIIYWLPLMQDNAYNIISFQGENYANSAKLSIEPQPDSILRVFMAWRPSDCFVDIPAPVIVPFVRQGFTVVEWGGTKVCE